MNDKYAALRLDNQICFPLYACSREIIKQYKPFLDKIDLTYTQYIVMLVLWDKKEVAVRELCKLLYLDSGTLTPVLKNMESKELIVRKRSQEDERVLIVRITQKGADLREQAVCIPGEIGGCVKLEPEEAAFLYKILYKILEQ